MKKKVVVIGGGTGTFTLLSGLKKYENFELTAVVAMSDEGGSTGVLRDELGILPPGDIRQCLVGLSESDHLLRKLFNYRFEKGTFKGHSFGNLFISAMEKVTGSFEKAVEKAGEVLSIRGDVYPVTLNKVRLVANFKNGKKIVGEHNISDASLKGLTSLKLTPRPKANPKAIKAIMEADLVVISPGGLFYSIVPNLLVPGIPEAIKKSKALKVCVCNLMAKKPHTGGFSVSHHVRVLEKYLDKNAFDYVIYNTSRPPSSLLKKYKSEGDFVECKKKTPENYVGSDLFSNKKVKASKADFLQRTLIRHDPDKIAKALNDLVGVKMIVFDLDDTILNTTELLSEQFKDAISSVIALQKNVNIKEVRPIVEKVFSSKKSTTLSKKVKDLFGIRYRDIVDKVYSLVDLEKLHLERGVEKLLGNLKKKYSLALVTFGAKWVQQEKIDVLGLKKYFDHIQIVDRKDDKQKSMLEFFKKASIEPRQALVVGDKIDAEIAFGKSLGATTVRILKGRHQHTKPKSKFEKPDYTISDLAEIKDLL